jgi:hypothetical protein
MTQGDPHNLEQRLENTVQSLESKKISSNGQQILEKFGVLGLTLMATVSRVWSGLLKINL